VFLLFLIRRRCQLRHEGTTWVTAWRRRGFRARRAARPAARSRASGAGRRPP